eukprot:2995089-Pleurochrysis_carterae.AAC.1
MRNHDLGRRRSRRRNNDGGASRRGRLVAQNAAGMSQGPAGRSLDSMYVRIRREGGCRSRRWRRRD